MFARLSPRQQSLLVGLVGVVVGVSVVTLPRTWGWALSRMKAAELRRR